MTDRTPDYYLAEFWDGPLEGTRIELPYYPVSVCIILQQGRSLRYEADENMATDQREDGTWGDVSRLVVTRDPESFDEDFQHDLKQENLEE